MWLGCKKINLPDFPCTLSPSLKALCREPRQSIQGVLSLKWSGRKSQLNVFCTMCSAGAHHLCQFSACLCRRINPSLHANPPTGKALLTDSPVIVVLEPRGRGTGAQASTETTRLPSTDIHRPSGENHKAELAPRSFGRRVEEASQVRSVEEGEVT